MPKEKHAGEQPLACLSVVHASSPEARLKLQRFGHSRVKTKKVRRGVEGDPPLEKKHFQPISAFWQLETRRERSNGLRLCTFISLGTLGKEKTQIPAAQQSMFSCQHEYSRFTSEHAGPIFSEKGTCLFSSSKLANVPWKNACNYIQSTKHKFVLIMKTGSSVWDRKTPSTGSYKAWIPAQPGWVTHLSCDSVLLLVRQDKGVSKDLFGFHILGVSKCQFVVVNSKYQGLCLIYFQGLSESCTRQILGEWMEGWLERKGWSWVIGCYVHPCFMGSLFVEDSNTHNEPSS